MEVLFTEANPNGVIPLAAEPRVDRPILEPPACITTNAGGTVCLLNAGRGRWAGRFEGKRFYRISTDEVYGRGGREGLFTEQPPYDSRSARSQASPSGGTTR